MKYSGSFNIFAQNIDCGNSLEPPHQFYFIRLGFKGVKLYTYVFVMSAT